MPNFIKGDFLLDSPRAREIYHEFAKDLPIVDYHTRLSAKDIYENKYYKNITEMMLIKDHSIWRLMRANGVDEKYISGEASDKEKFFAFCSTVERAIGNPISHWAHMQLRMIFDIHLVINEENAQELWHELNSKLGPEGLKVRDILRKLNVKIIAVNEEPFADLRYHRYLKEEKNDFLVVPTFRIDNIINIEFEHLGKDLLQLTGRHIHNLYEFEVRIKERIEYFHERGCRSFDLGETEIFFEPLETDVIHTFEQLINYQEVTEKELLDLKTYLTHEVVTLAVQKDWVFKMHFGNLLNVNQSAVREIGPYTGFDAFAEQVHDRDKGLLFMFNQLKLRKMLGKTVLYTLSPEKNMFSHVVAAAFQESKNGVRGIIQHGSAWWFQNTSIGHRKELELLAEQGVLRNSIGMNIDSRSFLAFVQHDYYRRILCNMLGKWIDRGLMPGDDKTVQGTIEDICYKNAIAFFDFDTQGLDI